MERIFMVATLTTQYSVGIFVSITNQFYFKSRISPRRAMYKTQEDFLPICFWVYKPQVLSKEGFTKFSATFSNSYPRLICNKNVYENVPQSEKMQVFEAYLSITYGSAENSFDLHSLVLPPQLWKFYILWKFFY